MRRRTVACGQPLHGGAAYAGLVRPSNRIGAGDAGIGGVGGVTMSSGASSPPAVIGSFSTDVISRDIVDGIDASIAWARDGVSKRAGERERTARAFVGAEA